MSPRIAHVVSVVLLAVGVSLLTASCSSLLTNDSTANAVPSRKQQSAPQRRIAQLYFGREASYRLCVEPACPAITPKTAVVTEPAASPVTVPVALPTPISKPAAIPVSTETSALPKQERIVLRYPSGGSELDAYAKQRIDKMIPVARRSEKIVIMGRTDNVGSAKINQTLALHRALRVRDYLRSQIKDVDNTIEIDARGSCCFLSTNDTPDGRQENRRVEIIFTIRS